MTLPRFLAIALAVAVVIALALLYDRWIDRVSTTGGALTGIHAKCGPWTQSGPKEPTFVRAPKLYMLMARLDDGRLVRVEREAKALPPCGATLTIAERVTPWGSVWYSTGQ